MKKDIYKLVIIALLLITCSFIGCSSKSNQTEPVRIESESKESAFTETETHVVYTETETQITTESEVEITLTEAPLTEVPLTAEEIKIFTEYIQQRDNRGFLLSSYTVPQEIDLPLLLYNGIEGGEQIRLTGEEAQAYIDASGQDIQTDITRFTTAQIDEYLYTKMEIHYEEVYTPLDWLYLAEYDKYYNQHGDVIGTMYSCVSGSRRGDIIYLDCSLGMAGSLDNSHKAKVTLKQNGDVYLFQSNQLSEESSSAAVPRTIELYDVIYNDLRVFKDSSELPEKYCRVTISNVTDTSFDFMIDQFDPETGMFNPIFYQNTAIFTGSGNTAAYYGQEYTLDFRFPDITSIEISGFEPTEGVVFAHNAIPGHEFGS